MPKEITYHVKRDIPPRRLQHELNRTKREVMAVVPEGDLFMIVQRSQAVVVQGTAVRAADPEKREEWYR